MRYMKTALAVLFFAALAACTSADRQEAEKQGSVSATRDFVRHFGPAPSVDKGTCYAFVIYFPSAREPGKVVPFPFFSFDQASLKKVALGKLVGGMGELKAYRGEISQPFPPGTRVLNVVQADGKVTANFSKELAGAKLDAVTKRAVANAIVLTLRQFEGVSAVAIQVEGAQDDLDKQAGKGDEGAVVQLAAPRLLGVVAMKEKGESDVEEIDVFFDRPVRINQLVVAGADGKQFQGDVYHSVFDMAGVLKPKDPALLKAGLPVKVRWNVTDNLGRSASGESEVHLEVREH